MDIELQQFAKASQGALATAGYAAAYGKDAYFVEFKNEFADKGFVVTTTDELITWARTGSMIG